MDIFMDIHIHGNPVNHYQNRGNDVTVLQEEALLMMEAFYRATLCVSAVFVVGRCPSVRPSVCHVGAFYLHA